MYDGFTYFAWLVLAILFLVAVAIIVALGSLPKKIATGRNHPQVDAINACSWIGLALESAEIQADALADAFVQRKGARGKRRSRLNRWHLWTSLPVAPILDHVPDLKTAVDNETIRQ